MGAKLAKIYDVITEKKGYDGRIRFAQKTGVSKSKALKTKDSDELIHKMTAAANEFIGEENDLTT